MNFTTHPLWKMSKISYPLEKIKAFVFDIDGVLSPSVIPLGADGIPRRMANLKDGYAMVQALKAGLKIAIISGATSPGVRDRFKRIGNIDFFDNIPDKLPVLKQWIINQGLTPDEIIYVGDDVPDVEAMRFVGLPITPADGSRDTKLIARYITDANGGHGVAREVIEEVMRVKRLWPVFPELS